MRLNEFERMWRKDPAVERLTKDEDVEREGFRFILYHVLYKDRQAEYGRHAGLRVKVNRVNEVIEHDIFNMTINQNGSWVEAIQTWFNAWVINYPATTISSTSAGSPFYDNGTATTSFYYTTA